MFDMLIDRAAACARAFVLCDAFGTQSLAASSLTGLQDAGVVAVPFRPLSLWTLHLVSPVL